MNKDEPILVVGGTGHYGREIVRNLQKKDVSVRVLSRNVVNARKILGKGSEIVEGDIISSESRVESLEGVRAVVISISAFSRKLIRKLRLIEQDSVLRFIEDAAKAGVSRLVYISVFDIQEDLLKKLDLHIESSEIKLEVEAAIKNSDFNWTILGAPPSMEIFFSMIRGDKMMVPGGGPPALPTISPLDLGEIAAQAVLRDDLHGKRFRLAGPEALSFPEAAKRISDATGMDITVRKIPLLPIKIASIVTRPITPYIRHFFGFIKLLNNFPQELAAEVPKDHQILLETFDYTPTTLEKEIQLHYS